MNCNTLHSGLKAGEVSGLTIQILSSYNSCGLAQAGDAYLNKIMDELNELSHRLSKSLFRQQPKTTMKPYDRERMRRVRSIVNLKKSYDTMPPEMLPEQWPEFRRTLDNVLKGMHDENFATKSSLIRALISRMSKPEWVSTVEQLAGMKQALSLLEEAQKAFDNKNIEIQSLVLKKAEPSTKVKNEIVAFINQRLVVHLSAQSNAATEVYGDFAKILDFKICEANAIVRQRKKKKKNKAEVAEMPTDAETTPRVIFGA